MHPTVKHSGLCIALLCHRIYINWQHVLYSFTAILIPTHYTAFGKRLLHTYLMTVFLQAGFESAHRCINKQT